MPDKERGPDQVSNFNLKLSYWYVSNKLRLKQALVAFLIIANVSLFAFAGYRAVKILFFDDKILNQSLQNLTQQLIDYEHFRQVNYPAELEIIDFDAVNIGGGEFDYVAKVKNLNPKHIARQAVFELVSGGSVIASRTTFIYPEEEKYIMFFNQQGVSATANLRVSDVAWRRINQPEKFFPERLMFEINNVDFQTARETGLRGELPISTLTFDVANTSAYGYWTVGVYIALYSGSQVVGANYISLDNFMSGETKEAEVRFYENIPAVSRVDVVPEVDLLDSESYIPVD